MMQAMIVDAEVPLNHTPVKAAPGFALLFSVSLPAVPSAVDLDAALRLAGMTPFELLRSQPLIRYDRSLGGGQMIERYLRANQITVQRERFELSSLVAISMMVDRGLGVAVVPDTALDWPDGHNVVRLALPGQTESRRFGTLWLRSSPRLARIRRLVDCAQAVVLERGYAVPGSRPSAGYAE